MKESSLSEVLRLMRGNVLVLTVCSVLWRMSIDIISPFLSLYVMALGGEYETVGQVMAIGNLASMVLYPLGGYLADYQGRIKVMAYMTFVYSGTFLSGYIYRVDHSLPWVVLSAAVFITGLLVLLLVKEPREVEV